MAESAQATMVRAGPPDDLLSIVRMLPDVIFRCEKRADGKIYWTLNEGKLAEEFHLTTKEIQGKPLEELFPPDAVQRLLPEFERSFRGETHEFYNELFGRTFKHVPQPIKDASGRVTAVVGFISEVTNLVKAEAQIRTLYDQIARHAAELATANRELEAFSFTVSHDLRSPLTVIDAVNQLLQTKYAQELSADAKKDVKLSRDALRRMSQLIEDLLSFSRSSRGELHRAPVDLSPLVETIVGELARSEPGRTVEVDVQPGAIVDADARLARVALENLLRNAWKFTRKQPRAHIEFGWNDAGNERMFYVRDNGAGFDPARKDHLFRAFERLHDAREFEGTGVGLSTVQRIVRRHGGRVWADGALGRGATFSFTLNPGGPRNDA